MIIFLDESGDLGWTFEAPYRAGGSSRHLTVASLAVSSNKKHLPKRLVRNLYKKYRWPTNEEKKWADMKLPERIEFATRAKALLDRNPEDIRYHSITVKKPNVQQHIQRDANKLYNYMIGLSLLDEMSKHQEVIFIPDPRSIKVESGNSLHDYLQTQLWFEKQASTVILTQPCDSSSSLNVQFADMLSGVVQGHFEDGNSQPWKILSSKVSYKSLFF